MLRRLLFLAMVATLPACAPACGHKDADDDHGTEASSGPLSMVCAPATKGPIERFVELRGRVSTKPGGSLPVESLVAGFVVEVRVNEGERVKQGAVVAIVDDLETKGEATQARAAVARAVATKVQTGSALDRAKRLVAEGIISKADLEAAQAADDAAKSDLAGQEAAANVASGKLNRVEVKSSLDGIVTKVWRGPGALVDGVNGNGGPTPIVDIASDESLEFVGDTTERDLELLSIGEKADLVLSASAATLHGSVVFVPRAVDPKTGLGEIRILLDKPQSGEGAVRIGAFGHARVHARPTGDAISIPRAALRGAILDGAEVAVCSDGKASIRKITVGYRDSERLEVLSGLEAGDRVAVGDVLGVSEGTPIAEASASASATEPSAAPSSSALFQQLKAPPP